MSKSNATPPSICFVIPYFGEWPFWMPFFIESCRANPTIDWLLLSDCGQIENCPQNVRLVDVTYEAYCDQVSKRLGIHFHPQNPYKLCDLKPALGYVHEHDLAGYDFWAFGDIDLVYGDLRAYFTVEKLTKLDLMSTHARRVSGHCCLIRNTSEMRELFFQVRGWKDCLQDETHHAFDEGAFSRLFVRHKNWPEAISRTLNRMHRRFRQAEFNEAYTTPNGRRRWHDGTQRYPECWFWRDGVLTNERDGERSFPYFHFMFWKKREWRSLAPESIAASAAIAAESEWEISAKGFRRLRSGDAARQASAEREDITKMDTVRGNVNKHIHIVGCSPRSGTTLMQEMIATCFETDWCCEHERSIYARGGVQHDGIVCTKHPRQAVYAPGALWANPNLYILYMVRDPRDVIVSKHARAPEHYYATLSFYLCAEKAVAGLRNHPRFIPVKYEDLVSRPDAVQAELARKMPFLTTKHLFSEFDRHASVSSDSARALNGVRAPDARNTQKWRKHLPRVAAQFARFPEALEILTRYGYEPDDSWAALLPEPDVALANSLMAIEDGGEHDYTLLLRYKAARKAFRYFRKVRFK